MSEDETYIESIETGPLPADLSKVQPHWESVLYYGYSEGNPLALNGRCNHYHYEEESAKECARSRSMPAILYFNYVQKNPRSRMISPKGMA